MANDPDVQVYDQGINLRFRPTIHVSSIVDGNFALFLDGATPVTAAFAPINISADYNTISRALQLEYGPGILPNRDYTLVVSNLLTAALQPVSTRSYNFTTLASTKLDDALLEPEAEQVYAEDHSVRQNVFTSYQTIVEANPNFYIVSVDPDALTPIISNNYNNGRITIEFSAPPSANYLTPQYFRAQTKLLQRGLGRWQDVAGVIVSLDARDPIVYLDFPSLDATPVYGLPGHMYFVDGNKYRIKISRNIIRDTAL